MIRKIKLFLALLAAAATAGCTTLSHKSDTPLSVKGPWGISRLLNNTETPYASERATAILWTLLRSRGIEAVEVRGQEKQSDRIAEPRDSYSESDLIEKGRQANLRYLVTGTVTEWRYKVGLDGEPVAGITLQVIDLQSGKRVWSGSAAKSGWGRESLSGVGQQVLSALIETIPTVP